MNRLFGVLAQDQGSLLGLLVVSGSVSFVPNSDYYHKYVLFFK